MKVSLSRADAANLIGKVQTIVSGAKPALPILANVLLEASGGELTLSATDLTVSMKAVISAKVEEAGSVTLPAKRFFQLVRELTAPQIEIHCPTSETAFVHAGSSRFKVNGMDKTEFPHLPDFSDALTLEIPARLLKETVSRTAFASAKDDNRQELGGILLSVAGNTATFVATDGKRLARNSAQINNSAGVEGSYLIPNKAVEEIARIIESGDENVKLMLSHDKIALDTGEIVLMTKLLSAQYPDVSRVIPEAIEQPIALHREELVSLLRQISLFTPDNSSSVRFLFEDNTLYISATAGEIGEGKVSMPVNYTGERLEIAFNPYYFLDILRHSSNETVMLSVTNPYNPGLITDETSANFVIMPMRLEPEAMAHA